MHAPRAGRLIAAWAEVQAFVGGTVGRLKRMTLQLAWFIRQPPKPDRDPVLVMLAAAPADDEPVTDDDRRHIDDGRRAYRDARVVSSEDVRRRFLGAKGDTDRATADRADPM